MRNPLPLLIVLSWLDIFQPMAWAEEINQPARAYFTDVKLTDHQGQEHRLYSDLMADHTVVINVLFTSCQGVCPVTLSHLKKIQTWLGPRLGSEVRILSLTVDPEMDTPEKLGEHALAMGAEEGWFFLTGPQDNLEFALSRLGLQSENKEAHSPLFLIGNVPTGLWKKAMGLAEATELIAILDTVLKDQLEPATDIP